MTVADDDRRFSLATARLKEVVGDPGALLISALERIAPTFSRQMVEFSYGDIYADEGLDLLKRQVVAVSCLAALGHTTQLKVHLNGALNVGMTRQEIIQVLAQVGLYAGLPAATNALLVAEKVFQERRATDP